MIQPSPDLDLDCYINPIFRKCHGLYLHMANIFPDSSSDPAYIYSDITHSPFKNNFCKLLFNPFKLLFSQSLLNQTHQSLGSPYWDTSIWIFSGSITESLVTLCMVNFFLNAVKTQNSKIDQCSKFSLVFSSCIHGIWSFYSNCIE